MKQKYLNKFCTTTKLFAEKLFNSNALFWCDVIIATLAPGCFGACGV